MSATTTLNSSTVAPEEGDQIRAGVSLLARPGEVHELRALHVPQGRGYGATVSGYYDDPAALLRDVAQLDADGAKGVYLTVNPCDPRLLARRANRCAVIRDRDATTTDRDIIHRTRLYVDLDPVRPSEISSTASEHAAALDRVRPITGWLARSLGWPPPVTLDSGNGAALLYTIELPNDADALHVVESCLHALAARFGDEAVAVDTTVANAARIIRIPGGLNRKGDSTADRPHRRAHIVAVPDTVETVSRPQLNALARHAPVNPEAGP